MKVMPEHIRSVNSEKVYELFFITLNINAVQITVHFGFLLNLLSVLCFMVSPHYQ